MDLDALKVCWQREPRERGHAPVDERMLSEWLHVRATEVQRDVRRRLRQEAAYYVPVIAASAVSLIAGVTVGRVLAAGALAVLFGGIMGALWYSARSVGEIRLDQAVGEVLVELRSRIEFARRAYLVAYVVVFVGSAAAMAWLVSWRHGFGLALAMTVAAGLAAVAYAYWSGRAYVARMFDRDREEVTEYLRQFNSRSH
jgi:hypothetical protein